MSTEHQRVLNDEQNPNPLLVNLVKESVRLELAYVVEIPELYRISLILDIRVYDLSNAIGIV